MALLLTQRNKGTEMSNHKVNEQTRKNAILKALETPMDYKQLGAIVGTYRLNEFVADLKAERRIYYNDTDGVLELWR